MSNSYYIGDVDFYPLLGENNSRFFYGLRRDSDGTLYVVKVDQVLGQEEIAVNRPGDPAEDYPDFEFGIDFLEGIQTNHEITYDNLVYPQYKWDPRNLYYYLNSEGELVVRVNQPYTYPNDV